MENSNKCSGNVFNINDCVVYGSAGVCRLTGIEKQCFDGEHEMDYFILSPLHSSTSKYYLPVNKCSNKIRKLLTKDEIISLIDSAAKSDDVCWQNNSKERKSLFNSILNSDDCEKMLEMLKTLHFHQEKQKLNGKKLISSDEIAMKTAENVLFQEFSIVLGIDYDSVEDFIISRANKLKS